MATVGMAAFSWINSSLTGIYRVEQQSIKQKGGRLALSWLSSLNIMEESEGEERIGAFTVHWQGSLIEAVQPAKSPLEGSSFFNLGLYDVKVIIESEGKIITEFSVVQVGYNQIREFSFGL
jgi:general secretion pathway protein I